MGEKNPATDESQVPAGVASAGRAYHQKRNVKIIVDSTADYAPGVAHQLGVEVIPFTYVTPEGERLGAWVNRQRRIREGKVPGALTPERVRALDAIGMVW